MNGNALFVRNSLFKYLELPKENLIYKLSSSSSSKNLSTPILITIFITFAFTPYHDVTITLTKKKLLLSWGNINIYIIIVTNE